MATSEQLENTKNSLERVQKYDVESLSREDELGTRLTFASAIEPGKRVISVFERLSPDHLEFFPDNELSKIQQEADAFFNLLESVKEFDPEVEGNNATKRDSIVTNIENYRQRAFTALHPFISYIAAIVTDFSKLEHDARAAVQAAKDDAEKATESIAEYEETAQGILTTIQQVAAEQGVSQQAVYFKDEAATHQAESEKWRLWTVLTAAGLAVFAVLSLFIHKWEWLGLVPATEYETFQLALSKILIFGVIAYMMLLCSRNFLAHKHNSIINKHRQNALLTFTALVEAAQDRANQDIVLTAAADSIFTPQETGYVKQGNNVSPASVQTVVRSLPRSLSEGARDTVT